MASGAPGAFPLSLSDPAANQRPYEIRAVQISDTPSRETTEYHRIIHAFPFPASSSQCLIASLFHYLNRPRTASVCGDVEKKRVWGPWAVCLAPGNPLFHRCHTSSDAQSYYFKCVQLPIPVWTWPRRGLRRVTCRASVLGVRRLVKLPNHPHSTSSTFSAPVPCTLTSPPRHHHVACTACTILQQIDAQSSTLLPKRSQICQSCIHLPT